MIPVVLWSFSAVTLGTAVAARDAPLAAGWYAAACVIGLLLQGLLAHSVNEIADWRSGTDRDPAPRVLSGGSKVIPLGLLTEAHLRRIAVASALSASALGLVVAAARGWQLVLLGAVGVAGALAYSLPGVAAAYRPGAGEAVAFLCVAAAVAGGFAVQAGAFGADLVLPAAAHGAVCVAMLLLHHYADRGPDLRARPPKRTTPAVLAGRARRYGIAWSLLAVALGAAAAAAVHPALLAVAAAGVVAVVAHAVVDPDDVRSVTLAEGGVIAAGIAGALVAASIMVPALSWAALVPVGAVAGEFVAARLAPAIGVAPPDA
jgi:1,4-dihydroxy-2-naphthoate octaprenyltransferase